ncbi:MAG: IS200/IS605 family transposase [Candidatus Kapabacteria bacterium]|nr:IS200/IS605 family transposase [Candidatus Kapabacteria bacterium]
MYEDVMGHSHTSLCYHLIFSTKLRLRLIDQSIEGLVWSILWNVCVRLGFHPYAVGGVEDHIHIAVSIPPTIPVSEAIGRIKNLATREIRNTIPSCEDFEWQVGYGAFTFSHRNLDAVVRYIHHQRAHHH